MKGGDDFTPKKQRSIPIPNPARPTKPNEKLRYEELKNEYIGTFERFFPQNIEDFQKKLENKKQIYEEEITNEKDIHKIRNYKKILDQIEVLINKIPKIKEKQENLGLFGLYTLPNTSTTIAEETELNNLLDEINLLQQRYQDLIEAEAAGMGLNNAGIMVGGKKKRSTKKRKGKKKKNTMRKQRKRSKKIIKQYGRGCTQSCMMYDDYPDYSSNSSSSTGSSTINLIDFTPPRRSPNSTRFIEHRQEDTNDYEIARPNARNNIRYIRPLTRRNLQYSSNPDYYRPGGSKSKKRNKKSKKSKKN